MSTPPSFVQLTASAGSGKTYALTQRYLTLLAAAGPQQSGCRPPREAGADDEAWGYSWPEILAITFTNQAAMEMRARVLSAIKQRALGQSSPAPKPLTPDDAGRLVNSILRSAHLLGIRTIDSLLSRIVMAFALELRLPPTAEVFFDPGEVFGPLYEDLLAAARADGPEADLLEDAARKLLVLDQAEGFWLANRLRSKLLEVFAHRLTAGIAVNGQAGEDALRGALVADAADLKRLSLQLLEILRQCGAKPHKKFQEAVEKIQTADAYNWPKPSAYFSKETLAECVAAASRGKLTDQSEQIFAALKAASTESRRRRAAILGALRLAPFVRLADTLHKHMQADQRQRGLVPAAGWPAQVRGLLHSPEAAPQVFCRMGAGVRHLLLDEFQDTSREQWLALGPLAEECLSTGGQVFYVGDVKQAIYGWRGGDAALFSEVAQGELSHMAPVTRERLPYNWRSCPAVVNFVGKAFGPLEEPLPARELAQALLPADAPEDNLNELARSITQSFAGCVQELPPQKQQDTPPGTAAIYHLQASSKDDLQAEALDGLMGLLEQSRGQGRKLGDMAVLVRTGGQAQAVAAHLSENGVAAVTEQSLLVAEHPLVRQLLAFLRFLHTPDNDLAFWTFIRGRELFVGAAGLADDKLHAWLTGCGVRPLHQGFKQAFPQIYQNFVAPFLNRAGLMRPYDLAACALQVFAPLQRHPQSAVFARRFLEILHGAEAKGRHTLGAFLDYFDELGGQERLPAPEGLDAVTVMTVHKSKGLEFPVVAVPFHDWQPRPSGTLATVHLDGLGPVLTPLCKDLGQPYYAKLAQEQLEHIHLLYVAWTRAVEELHLFVPQDGFNGTVAAGVRLLLKSQQERVLPCPWPHAAGPAEPQVQEAGAAAPATSPPPTLPQDDAPLTRWLPRLKVARNFRPSSRHHLEENERGRLAHAALERLRPPADPNLDASAIRRSVHQALNAAPGLPPNKQDALRDDLCGLLDFVLQTPLLRQCLANGRAESSLLAPDGRIFRPDLLAELDGTLAVVDYKTGQPSPTDEQDHARQVRAYMRLAARAQEITDVSGYVAYLDQRRLVPVSPEGPQP